MSLDLRKFRLLNPFPVENLDKTLLFALIRRARFLFGCVDMVLWWPPYHKMVRLPLWNSSIGNNTRNSPNLQEIIPFKQNFYKNSIKHLKRFYHLHIIVQNSPSTMRNFLCQIKRTTPWPELPACTLPTEWSNPLDVEDDRRILCATSPHLWDEGARKLCTLASACETATPPCTARFPERQGPEPTARRGDQVREGPAPEEIWREGGAPAPEGSNTGEGPL